MWRSCYTRPCGAADATFGSAETLVIEMTLVHRPFLLDFATAQLDEPLDFPVDILEEWERDKAEQFGANWPAARSVLAALEGRCGIYMLDVHPGNIGFPDS